MNNEDALGEAIYRKKRNADDLSEDFGDLSARTRRGITKKRESGDFGDFSVRKKRGIAKKREAGGFGDFIARKPMACVVDFGDLIYRKKRTAMLESRDNGLVRRPKLRSQVSVLASRFWCRDRTFGPRLKAMGPVFETIILGSSYKIFLRSP